jgi:hypothetical protein
LGIISDLCSVYKQEIKNMIDINLINSMVNNLRNKVSKNDYERFIKLIEEVSYLLLIKYFKNLIV